MLHVFVEGKQPETRSAAKQGDLVALHENKQRDTKFVRHTPCGIEPTLSTHQQMQLLASRDEKNTDI